VALVDTPESASVAERTDAVVQTLARLEACDYIGEPVSQLQHALQAGERGLRTGDGELGLAGLLHDLGHVADPAAPQMEELGAVGHERIGGDVLRRLGFSERVAALVERHVDAKRYLARGRAYGGKLSEASARTLEHQGGVMDDAEAAAFEADPHFDDALRLRAWDEAAKEPGASVAPLESWRARIEDHLSASEIAGVLAPLDRPLTADELASWRRDHLLVLPSVFDARALGALARWTADLQARPETPGKWMKYFESGETDRQLCRVEDFVPHHDGFAALLTAGPLLTMLGQLMGEPAVLFKEKINFKLPGGAGFTAHQDAPAFTAFDQSYHLTVLVAVDPSDRSNGGLEFAEPVEVGRTLAQRPGGAIAEAVEASLTWRPVDLPAGSIAVFDSYIPHRSPANASPSARRGLYITYNRASEGDRRADYFADKRATFPPEIERVPGVDYLANAGRYNVGNPIR